MGLRVHVRERRGTWLGTTNVVGNWGENGSWGARGSALSIPGILHHPALMSSESQAAGEQGKATTLSSAQEHMGAVVG